MNSTEHHNEKLFIPTILGTARQGRKSEHVARFVAGEVAKRADGLEVARDHEGSRQYAFYNTYHDAAARQRARLCLA